jgi:nucleoside-diphosphate-sugar epimerase
MRVLVTGASGAIGRRVCAELLRSGHAVRGFDRSALAFADFPHVVGELTDAGALASAVVDVDAIVHLAATPDRAAFVEDLVPNNIVGSYRVLEAARAANVGRVVFASSARVASPLDEEKPRAITVEDGYRPGDFYALSKCCGELLAEMFARQHGITVVCARIGWFVRDRREAELIESLPHLHDIYLSHRDALSFFVAALAADITGFHQLFVTSKNGGKPRYDLGPTARLLGYEPRDTWPEGWSWEES